MFGRNNAQNIRISVRLLFVSLMQFHFAYCVDEFVELAALGPAHRQM